MIIGVGSSRREGRAMTREEAINIMKVIVHMLEEKYDTDRVEDAVEMAVQALEQQPNIDMDSEEIKILQKRSYLEGFHEALKMSVKQEPCEDCISRAEAINAISHAELSFQVESDLNFENYKREVQEIADGILKGQVKAISDLPSIQPKPKTEWIPVSERLPKAFEYVNCTCHSLIDDREDWVVETCYIPQPQNSPYSDWGNIPMLNHGECEVVAWMYREIPEPYKAESEETE